MPETQCAWMAANHTDAKCKKEPLQTRTRAHLQRHPQALPRREELHRGRDTPLNRGTGRDGLGHLQRPTLQDIHALQRQLLHGDEVLPQPRP